MANLELMQMDLIFQNIYAALAQLDSTIQLWTTFTFAVIVAASYQILLYHSLLVARNYEHWPVPAAIGGFIGLGTFILIFVGSIGTLWFLFSCIKSPQPNDS